MTEARTALVTGAGSGIGRASALALAEAGFQVILTGRTEAKLRETQAMASKHAGKLTSLVCDIDQPASVDALFETIKDQFSRLDILFNNAGAAMPSTPLDEISYDAWNRLVQTNLTGTFLCTRGAFRLMKEQHPQGGRIINNGSISAHSPRPGSAPYTATKHAITGLTKATALDGRPFNIACGQIDIGNASTDMTASMSKGVPQASGEIRPEPTMDTSLVAKAVVQMASLPLDANISTMTLMATQMPYIGRG